MSMTICHVVDVDNSLLSLHTSMDIVQVNCCYSLYKIDSYINHMRNSCEMFDLNVEMFRILIHLIDNIDIRINHCSSMGDY